MAKQVQAYRMLTFKNRHHEIIECSDDLVRCAGVKSDDGLLGKTDFDLPWQDYAELYLEHEKAIFSGNIYSSLIPLNDHSGHTNIFLHNKYCEFDETGEFIRLVCYASELINPCVYELSNQLARSLPDSDQNPCFELGHDPEKFGLTEREHQCLFYLLQGKSSKSIAEILNIARRTVDSHIELIKSKFHCSTRDELVDQAIDMGFLSIVPSGLMLKHLVEGLHNG